MAPIHDGKNIYSWLDQVQQRPGMYAQGLATLSFQISGYYAALHSYGIVEAVPAMHHHFNRWVYIRTGWCTACGWADAIESRFSGFEAQLNEFFRLVEEYRRLVPTVLCSAELANHHQPTGKRVVIGFNGRMERPERVDILRYKPDPLHFMRFHYSTSIRVGSLLMKRDGSHETSIFDAKAWVRDELRVKRGDWTKKPTACS